MGAIAILTIIVGAEMAIKMYQLFKMLNIPIDDMNKKQIESLLKNEDYFKMLDDPKYLKYMR